MDAVTGPCWRLWRFDLPLKRPLTVLGAARQRRRGLVLEIVDETGRRGLGEASPLPGLHEQTIDQAGAEIAAWCRGTSNIKHDTPDAVLESLGSVARFGVESALWDQHLADDEGGEPRQVACAALLGEASPTSIQRAAELAASGVTTFKLKVGRGPVEDDVAAVQALAAALPSHVRLRADANRSWSLEDAVVFGEVRGALEFVEEPLRDPGQLDALWEAARLPVALDESLLDQPQALPCPAVVALVLKPSVLGGVRNTLDWARRARRRGQAAIVSATFESAVGMRALVRLADAVGGDVAHGLGTWRWFAHDLLEPPVRSQPAFALPLPVRPDLHHKSLTLVDEG